jgi:paraquat-inducible protein B
VALTAGCDKEQTTSQQIDKIKTETKEAAQTMKDYTYAQKDEFVKQMQSQLAALDQDLNRLSAKVESSSDAVRAEAKPKLQALREQEAQLNKQLEDIKNANEELPLRVLDEPREDLQRADQFLSRKISSLRWMGLRPSPPHFCADLIHPLPVGMGVTLIIGWHAAICLASTVSGAPPGTHESTRAVIGASTAVRVSVLLIAFAWQ